MLVQPNNAVVTTVLLRRSRADEVGAEDATWQR